MRGQYETVTAGTYGLVPVAGVVIRYAFYAVGALVLGLIGIGILSVWRVVPKAVDAPPAFRITAGEFASKRHQRACRDQLTPRPRRGAAVRPAVQPRPDLAVALVMPPKGIGMGTQFVQDLTDINLLRAEAPDDHVADALRSRHPLRRIPRHRDARRHRRPLEAMPRLPQPLRDRGGLSHRLVLRRQRQQAKRQRAGLHPRQAGDRARARLEGGRHVPARPHGQGGLLPGRAGDADHRHRPPRRVAAVALVAAQRDVPALQATDRKPVPLSDHAHAARTDSASRRGRPARAAGRSASR